MRRGHQVLAFVHIPKTGGLWMSRALRQGLGVRHLDVLPLQPPLCTPAEIDATLRVFPHVTSISGHGVRPHLFDLSRPGRLSFYTVLREPIERFRSHFQHEVEKRGKDVTLEQWMTRFRRDNWQVRMLAGERNLDKAIECLERLRFVGLHEHLAESFAMVRLQHALPGLHADAEHRVNPARSSTFTAEARAEVERVRDRVAEENALDLLLYRYAEETVWPRMVRQAGGRAAIEESMRAASMSRRATSTVTAGMADVSSKLQQKAFYGGFIWWQRRRAG